MGKELEHAITQLTKKVEDGFRGTQQAAVELNRKIAEMTRNQTQIQSGLAKLGKDLAEIDRRQTESEIKFEKFSDTLLALESRAKDLDEKIAISCKDLKFEMMKEIAEIEKRKNTFCVFGLKDEDNEQDLTNVKAIFNHLIGQDTSLVKVYRLGKLQDAEKPRVLAVECSDPKCVVSVLAKSRKMKDKQEWNKVYLGPNLTKLQREYEKVLKDELIAEAEKRNLDTKNGVKWFVGGRWGNQHLYKKISSDAQPQERLAQN